MENVSLKNIMFIPIRSSFAFQRFNQSGSIVGVFEYTLQRSLLKKWEKNSFTGRYASVYILLKLLTFQFVVVDENKCNHNFFSNNIESSVRRSSILCSLLFNLLNTSKAISVDGCFNNKFCVQNEEICHFTYFWTFFFICCRNWGVSTYGRRKKCWTTRYVLVYLLVFFFLFNFVFFIFPFLLFVSFVINFRLI